MFITLLARAATLALAILLLTVCLGLVLIGLGNLTRLCGRGLERIERRNRRVHPR